MSSANISEKTELTAYKLILTKIESRSFSSKHVSAEIKKKILDAARVTGSGMNVQHWRFVLIQDKDNLEQLATDSKTGKWVTNANFAVIVLTDPQYYFHMIDGGRAIQSMMLAAWSFGVASGIYAGIKADEMRRDFNLPSNLNITAVVAFGYPAKKILGKKDRKPLNEIAFLEKYGQKLNL
jgi:nitroreductase